MNIETLIEQLSAFDAEDEVTIVVDASVSNGEGVKVQDGDVYDIAAVYSDGSGEVDKVCLTLLVTDQ